MGALIIFPHEENYDGPLTMLFGPLEHAPNWQEDAIALLSVNPALNIASPRPVELLQGETKEQISERIRWEDRYAHAALRTGVVLFWFPRPLTPAESYAKEALFRLGKVFSYGTAHPLRCAIGVEPGFAGEVWIHELVKTHFASLPVFDSLEEVCNEAMRLTTTL